MPVTNKAIINRAVFVKCDCDCVYNVVLYVLCLMFYICRKCAFEMLLLVVQGMLRSCSWKGFGTTNMYADQLNYLKSRF